MIKNNKGYMLIEIILASAIAFGLAFFIIDLTIRLKNKNDDSVIETLTNTDKTIIANRLMEYAIVNPKEFNCDNLNINGKSVSYGNDVINVVNDYVSISNETTDGYNCTNEGGTISIVIPVEVKQMPKENYDIIIDYKYEIGDMVPPSCTLKIENHQVMFSTKTDNFEVIEFGINDSEEENYENSELPVKEGDFYGYVKDQAGNVGSCNMIIKTTEKTCPSGYSNYSNEQCRKKIGQNCQTCGGGCKSSEWVCTGWVNPIDNQCHGGEWKEKCTENYPTYPCNCYDSYDYKPYNYTCSSEYEKLNNEYCYK